MQDIYEATKFNPVPSVNEDTATNDEILLSSVKFNIQEISTTLWMKYAFFFPPLFFFSCVGFMLMKYTTEAMAYLQVTELPFCI